jgi:Uma2 family endonuclease
MAIQTRRYTLQEFEQIVDAPENADRLFEYIGGEIVEVPSNPRSSAIAYNIGFFIKLFVREHGIEGHVTGEAGGYMVSGERYAPDVAFISKAKQPRLAEKGYNPAPPDLAVEVMSPTDDPDDTQIKITNYLAAGTVVWLVNPDKMQVQVHTPGKPTDRILPDETLDGGDVLPGFSLELKDIFAD